MIIPDATVISKWAAKKSQSIRVADIISMATIPPSAGLSKPDDATTYWRMRGDRMRDCASHIIYNYCPECGSLHVARTNLCRDRLCPVCSWRLAMQRTGEMMAVLSHLADDGRAINAAMLTMTVRNVPLSGLDNAITAITDAWGRLRKRAIVRKWVAGYARSIEITAGAHNTYHPHIHVMVIWADGYAKHITQRDLCDMWRDALRADYTPVCDIRSAYTGSATPADDAWRQVMAAAVECCKYALSGKITTTISAPNDLATIALALRGRRLIAYGGIIADTRARLGLHDDDSPSDVGDITIDCPRCGAAMIQLGYTWAVSGYMLGLMPSAVSISAIESPV